MLTHSEQNDIRLAAGHRVQLRKAHCFIPLRENFRALLVGEPDPTRECHCTAPMIQRYVSKISGPLLDRIDIHIEVPAVKYKELRAVVIRRFGGGAGQGDRGARAAERTLQRGKEDVLQCPDGLKTDPQVLCDFRRGREVAVERGHQAWAFGAGP